MRWLKNRFARVRRDPIPWVGRIRVRLRQALEGAPRASYLPPVKFLRGKATYNELVRLRSVEGCNR